MINNTPFSQTNPAAGNARNSPSLAGEITGLNNELNANEDTIIQGYVREAATITYLANNSFSTTGNTTAYYTPGRLLRLNQAGTPIYVTVLSSSYNGVITTITVQETTVTNPVSTVDLALQPKGFTNPTQYSPTIKTPTITNPTVSTGTFTAPNLLARVLEINVPAYAASVTLDLSLHDTFSITLTGNITINLINVPVGKPFYIELINGNGVANTVTWFSTIKWGNTIVPTLSATNGRVDSFSFLCISSNVYRGFVNAQNMG